LGSPPMQVTQEKRPGSQVGFNVTVDAAQVQKSYEQTVRDFVKNVQIQGFRKGKAPRHLVLQYVGKDRVRASALEALLNNAIDDVMDKATDVEAISQFEFDGEVTALMQSYNPKADFTFSGYVEVEPEVNVGSYQSLEVEVERVDADPEKVTETIEGYRKQRATLLPVEDRAAQLGDVATLDFEGRDAEGEAIAGASGEDFQVELEESQFIPGFIAGIVGMDIDETREIEAEFPEDYANEDIAGQKATFTVTLKELKEKELPELDDAFASEISEFETLDALKQAIGDRERNDAIQSCENNLEEALLTAIVEKTEIDLPETLIRKEIEFLIRQSLSYLSQQGMDVNNLVNQEMLKGMQERSRPEATDRLLRTLSLAEIVRRENISVGDTELEMRVRDFYANYQGENKLDSQRVIGYFREEMLTEKVMTWLREQNTFNWVDAEGNAVDAPDLKAASESAEETAIAVEAEVVEDIEAVASVEDEESAIAAEADAPSSDAESDPETED
ncbi:MAG: trigger factor, partial [Cyanobacteria bacterium J06639_1]